MSNWINVNDTVRNFKELTKQLTGQQLAIGISRGINRTLMEGRTEARKAVKVEYNIPQSYLNGINFKKTLPTNLTGFIYAGTKAVPLDAFSPKFETSSRAIRNTKKGDQKIKERRRKKNNPGKGVSVEIHKGTRTVVPFAFMIPGGRPRIFARGYYQDGISKFIQRNNREKKTGTDTHVNPLMSVTLYQTVIHPYSIAKINNRVITEFPKKITHELKFLINKLPKG